MQIEISFRQSKYASKSLQCNSFAPFRKLEYDFPQNFYESKYYIIKTPTECSMLCNIYSTYYLKLSGLLVFPTKTGTYNKHIFSLE